MRDSLKQKTKTKKTACWEIDPPLPRPAFATLLFFFCQFESTRRRGVSSEALTCIKDFTVSRRVGLKTKKDDRSRSKGWPKYRHFPSRSSKAKHIIYNWGLGFQWFQCAFRVLNIPNNRDLAPLEFLDLLM